ncbi:MAG: efflux RND transporter permease subunit [Gemmataceae bacterium]
MRPILMTSFAFILGVVPLVIAEGAGAEMRRALGVAVFSGMLGVTLFGIFLTPVFFLTILWLTGGKRAGRRPGRSCFGGAVMSLRGCLAVVILAGYRRGLRRRGQGRRLARLKVSDNKRFLVTADGKPFFYLGDTAWEPVPPAQPRAGREVPQGPRRKGFTVIQAVAAGRVRLGLKEPNPYGQTP